jgi:hypothetical protein
MVHVTRKVRPEGYFWNFVWKRSQNLCGRRTSSPSHSPSLPPEPCAHHSSLFDPSSAPSVPGRYRWWYSHRVTAETNGTWERLLAKSSSLLSHAIDCNYMLVLEPMKAMSVNHVLPLYSDPILFA